MDLKFEFIKNKKILITGGLGFVGVNLTKNLLKNQIRPVLMDYRPDINLIDRRYLPFDLKSISYYNVDILKSDDITAAIKKIEPDIIIHLAGMTNLEKTFENAEIAIEVNLKGTLSILKATRNLKFSNFVFVSTSDIYGGVKPPFKENQLAQPASPYSASKASAEMFLLMFQKVYNMPITILRSFNLYGPYQPPVRIIPFIIQKLINDEEVPLTKGEQKREFNYIDDFIDGIKRSIIFPESQGKIINIGCGNSITIKEIAINIAKKIDKLDKLKIGKLPYRENEIWDMYCDNSVAKKILGWKPKVSFEEGLERTIEWNRNNR